MEYEYFSLEAASLFLLIEHGRIKSPLPLPCLEVPIPRRPVTVENCKVTLLVTFVNIVPGSLGGLVSRRCLVFREPDSQRLCVLGWHED